MITQEDIKEIINQHEKEHDLHFMPFVKAHIEEIVKKSLNFLNDKINETSRNTNNQE